MRSSKSARQAGDELGLEDGEGRVAAVMGQGEDEAIARRGSGLR